jgi:hypothetical protein
VKTKELIRQLQEADPSGELHVCVGNTDISFVSIEPAYYDGRQEIIERGEDCKVVCARITGKGQKIQIHCLSIDDAIFQDPGLAVKIDTGNPQTDEEYKAAVLKWRKEAVGVLEELETNHKFAGNEYNLQRIKDGKLKIAEEENEDNQED